MHNLRLELKICEGCGVLWLRSGKIDGCYCKGCSARLAEFPAPNPAKFRNKRVRLAGSQSARCRTRRRPCRMVDAPTGTTQPQPAIDWTGGAD